MVPNTKYRNSFMLLSSIPVKLVSSLNRGRDDNAHIPTGIIKALRAAQPQVPLISTN